MIKFSKDGHGAEQFKQKLKRIPTSVYLAYLLVATFLVTGVTFSSYVATASGGDEARVAVMAMDTSKVIVPSEKIAPGETVEFTVTLTNKEDNRICEVAQNYSMSVENLTKNMALTYKIQDAPETEKDSVTGTFKAGVEESATYRIKITWTGAPQPASSAFEVDALRIIIHSEQSN